MTESSRLSAIPRSAIDEIVWPAIPASGPATLLALQFQLDRSQWWPRELLESQQRRQILHLLRHAARTVPFYGERLAAAGYHAHEPPGSATWPQFWSRLPILRRHEIQSPPHSLRSTAVPQSHGAVRQVTTSGTSGTPLAVLKSQLDELIWQAITLREEIWQAREWQATVAVIRSFADPRYKYPDGASLPDWGSPIADLYQTGPAFALDMTARTDEQAQWLLRRNPDYLLSDAANLRLLVDHFRQAGLSLPKLRDVRAIGDVVDDALRDSCRAVWGVEVVDIYSCTEAGYLAIPCREHGRLHIQMESVALEILDAEGRPCEPGEVGEVVVTALHNFATPFIRYAIGDYAQMGDPCPCGRGLPVINSIVGRTQGPHSGKR